MTFPTWWRLEMIVDSRNKTTRHGYPPQWGWLRPSPNFWVGIIPLQSIKPLSTQRTRLSTNWQVDYRRITYIGWQTPTITSVHSVSVQDCLLNHGRMEASQILATLVLPRHEQFQVDAELFVLKFKNWRHQKSLLYLPCMARLVTREYARLFILQRWLFAMFEKFRWRPASFCLQVLCSTASRLSMLWKWAYLGSKICIQSILPEIMQ